MRIVMIVEVSDGQGKVDTFVVVGAQTGREAENRVRQHLIDQGWTREMLDDCYFETMRREMLVTEAMRIDMRPARPVEGDKVLTGTIRNPEYDTIHVVIKSTGEGRWLVDLLDADNVEIMWGDAGWAVVPA